MSRTEARHSTIPVCRRAVCGLRRAASGFTLLEVLVALAVLAIAMAAVIKATGDGARILGGLQGSTMAQVIAVDEMNRLRLSGDWPKIGRRSGQVEFEGSPWAWEREVASTEIPNLRKVTLRIWDDAGGRSGEAVLTAYLREPESGL
ncbi:MAG: type II secretion system minor pseudopilin GspI [Halothiobacillaceae bacterium]